MAEGPLIQRVPTDRFGHLLFHAARALALAGGLVIVALTLMSLVSIAGRALFDTPVPGDYELIQLGCAVAVASFLPLTQLRGGHVIVDFFTAKTRPGRCASGSTARDAADFLLRRDAIQDRTSSA